MYPGAKAERLLGGGSVYDNEKDVRRHQQREAKEAKKQAKARTHSLRKYSSSMSVTLAGISSASDNEPPGGSEHDGFPFPGMFSPSESRPEFLRSRLPSSPLLHDANVLRTEQDEGELSYSHPHANEPSHTIAAKEPPSRIVVHEPARGCATTDQEPPGRAETSNHYRHGARSARVPRPATMVAHESNDAVKAFLAEADSELKTATAGSIIEQQPRRRPGNSDVPTLHPGLSRTVHAATPPQSLVSSVVPSTLPKKLKWWQRMRADRHETPAMQQVMQDSRPTAQRTKMNVRRPRAGVSDWFDDLDEDELRLDESQCSDSASVHTPRASSASFHTPQTSISSDMRNLRWSPASTNISNHSHAQAYAAPSVVESSSPHHEWEHDGWENEDLPGLVAHPALRGSRSHSAIGQQNRLTRYPPAPHGPPTIPLPKLPRAAARRLHDVEDLQGVSMLDLSASSEEEEEVDAKSEIRNYPPLRHKNQRLRDSMVIADHGDAILVADAERIQNVRPRPIMNRVSRRATAESGAEEWGRTMSSRRTSTLMQVTQEEENLLEAMRNKRASLRLDALRKRLSSASMANLDGRPKTAGVDGRNTFDVPGRPWSLHNPYAHRRAFTSDIAFSPKGSTLNSARYCTSQTGRRKSGQQSKRKSLSVSDAHDGLGLGIDSFPFPQVPTRESVKPLDARQAPEPLQLAGHVPLDEKPATQHAPESQKASPSSSRTSISTRSNLSTSPAYSDAQGSWKVSVQNTPITPPQDYKVMGALVQDDLVHGQNEKAKSFSAQSTQMPANSRQSSGRPQRASII